MDKTTNEKIYIFYNQLVNKYNFLKKICIENIEKDIKNEKLDVKKNEYIELISKYKNLFEEEIKEELAKQIDYSIFDDDLPIEIEGLE